MSEQRDLKTILVAHLDLSNRAKNALRRRGIDTADKMMELTGEDLSSFRNVGAKTIAEILDLIDSINNGAEVVEEMTEQLAEMKGSNWLIGDRRNEFDEHIEQLYQYIDENDVTLAGMGLSRRSMNRLQTAGCKMFSDVVRMPDKDLINLPSMGEKSINEVKRWINDYITKHEVRIQAYIKGDDSALWEDRMISQKILDLYVNLGFGGLSFGEMVDWLKLPDFINEDKLKKVIGQLIAEHELEYVDFRCYRVYRKFEECLNECTMIDARQRDFINKRLQSYTLDAIGKEYDLTRERVRQVVNKGRRLVREWYVRETGDTFFDEDYYRYLYENYYFKKNDAAEWFGVPRYIWNYFDLFDIKQGNKDIKEAYRDRNLDMGMRLKIKSCLNRNRIYIDGKWIEKRRSELEDKLAHEICAENTSYKDFVQKYNAFLQKEDVPFDEDVYITDAVYRTRKNRLAESRFLLWKQNEQLRYYDIDSRDYGELLDVLNLAAYENIELSTLKLFEENPEIMEKYDIRDQYELHNLLRKIMKEGDYHDLTFGKMPMIRFGLFDKDAAILDIMRNNAPINPQDLADLVHKEYGYEQATVLGSYLPNLRQYLVDGVYTTDQKKMTADNLNLLSRSLTDDFYFIDEIKKIYQTIVPNADIEEINPYNLNMMGFSMYTRYALQNYNSLDDYFRNILLAEDILDLKPYRKRFCYVHSFSTTLNEMKRNLDIIEFEPNVVISFSKLEKNGITIEAVEEYCDAVYEFIEDNTYFSARSLRLSGFDSDLYELGFNDWFYANLLISDERFSYGNVFGSIILYKGDAEVTRESFLESRVHENESVDIFDLLDELSDIYGCSLNDDAKYDVIKLLRDTDVYYDSILDRLYVNQEAFYSEIEGNANE